MNTSVLERQPGETTEDYATRLEAGNRKLGIRNARLQIIVIEVEETSAFDEIAEAARPANSAIAGE